MRLPTPGPSLLLVGLLTIGFAAACDESAVDPSTDDRQAALQGQVLAPGGSAMPLSAVAAATDRGAAGPDLAGETPVPGVDVRVFDLAEMGADPEAATPVATVTTDSAGGYQADVPDGATVLLLVDTEPRLASFAHGVSGDAVADVTTATTLAAEHLGAEIQSGGSIAGADFTEAVGTVESALEGRSAADLSRALNALVPESFGDGLPGDPVAPSALAVVAALGGADPSVCEGLTLAATQGTPATPIALSGLTDDFGEEPWGWLYDAGVESPGEGDRHVAFIERAAADSGRFVVPVHPGNYMGGGAAELVVMSADSTVACPGFEVDVLALDPAPVPLDGVVDSLESALMARAEALGYDPAQLRTTPATELAPRAVPIAVGLQTIDGPDFDNSIRSLLSGEAPQLDQPLLAEDREVAAAVMNEAGFTDALLSTLGDVRGIGEPPAAPGAALESAARTVSAEENDLTIETPEQLDFWMDAQSRCAATRSGAAGAARTAGGLVIAGAGAIAGGPAVATVGGIILFLQELILRTCDQNFPSELVDLQVTAGPPTEFNEDATDRGPWTAFLAAESEGFSLSWPDVIGNVPGLGDLLGVAGKSLGLNADIVGYVHAVVSTTMGLDAESEAYSDPARTWAVEVHPERASTSTYFDWDLHTVWSQPENVEAFIFVDNDTRYLPTAAGEANLRVETKPQGSDVFNGQYEIGEDGLRVDPIEVTIESPRGRTPFHVDPGEQISFSADVENAHNDSVEWTATDGSFSETTGSWNEQATYTAPETEGRYEVRATSTASEGARSDGEPERYDLVEVVIGGSLVVSPNPQCVRPGEPVSFSATYGGEAVPFSDISTTVSGPGGMTADSVFEASGTGSVTITFEYQPPAADDPVTWTVTFEVEEMCTSISVSSSRMDYAAECVAYGNDLPDGVVMYHESRLPSGAVEAIITLTAITETAGEWSREIPGSNWDGGFGHHSNGAEYEAVDGGATLHIEREEVEIDGVLTGIYSGSVTSTFVGTYDGLDGDETITATVTFEDVPQLVPDACLNN